MIFIYTGHVCKHLTLVQHSFCKKNQPGCWWSSHLHAISRAQLVILFPSAPWNIVALHGWCSWQPSAMVLASLGRGMTCAPVTGQRPPRPFLRPSSTCFFFKCVNCDGTAMGLFLVVKYGSTWRWPMKCWYLMIGVDDWCWLEVSMRYLCIMICHDRSRQYLVGGLEHEFYFSIYWACHHPNWQSHIFQRGMLNHQPVVTVGSPSIASAAQ